jgi:hypothetical protein
MSLQGTSKSIFGFDPRTIGSCSLWLDASDQRTVELTGTGNVSTWKDKSSNLYVFSNVNISQNLGPTYTSNTNGKKVMTFTATSSNDINGQSLYNTTAVLNTVSTIFFVHNPTTTSEIGFGNTSVIFSGDPAENGNFFIAPFAASVIDTLYQLDYYGTSTFGIGNNINNNVANQYNLISLVIGSNVQNSLRNGSINVIDYASNAPGVITTGITIGGFPDPLDNRGYATSLFFSGNLAEIIVYDTELTLPERQNIEGYLAWKWGLETFSSKILPSNHPYYPIQPFSRYFNPIDVPGCVLWLDGADPRSMFQNSAGTTPVTAPGQTVQCWKDKSGRELNVSNGSDGPTYATTGLTFAGSVGLSNGTGYSSTAGANLFAVWSSSDALTRGTIVSVQYLSEFTGGYLDTTYMYLNHSSSEGYSSEGYYYGPINYSANETYLYSVNTDTFPTLSYSFNGSNSSAWTAPETGAFSNTVLKVGAQNGLNFNGSIKEILYYDTYMTTTQRQKIEGYLSKKWGVTLSSASHPFYNFPPSSPLSFLPNSIPGCELWLDAADSSTLTLSYPVVTQWNDKSGNGRNTTTIGGSPTYSSNFINLNGVGTYLVGPYVNATQFLTMFVIASVDFSQGTYASYYRLLSVGSTEANDYDSALYTSILHNASSTEIGGYRNNDTNYNTVTTNTTFLMCLQYDGTNSINYLNGGSASSVESTGSFGTTSYSIGRDVGNTDGGGSYTYWPGNVGEVIIFNESLSTTQRQQIEGYLAWKWGLQSQLPFIHPYYKFRTSQLAVKPLTPSTIATVILEDLNGYNGTVTWTVSTNATNYIMIVGTGPGTGEVARDYRGDVLSGIVSYSFAENIDYYAWVIPVSSTGTAGIPTISAVASYGPPA